MNRKQLTETATAAGLVLDTWSPGDGATRYRFGLAGGSADYFGMEPLFTALGLAEARTWLRGYVAGHKRGAVDLTIREREVLRALIASGPDPIPVAESILREDRPAEPIEWRNVEATLTAVWGKLAD